ncbi:MAG TPA: biotin/lipoyl-containing protein [Anaeromyxobacteraceae bacterium]|jgi:biotin carboxyl carrier protein|nr:biotin/lipoyl-containing protein [Anaeromyxobacteraceae bacterium]
MSRATYVALLDGGQREETLEVSSEAPGLYEVRVGGRTYRVDVFRHDYGTLSVLLDAQSYSVTLDRGKAGLKVQVRDSVHALEILDERRLRMRRASGRFTAAGPQTVASPMPGKVVKVLVRPGDEVKQGQGLVVVEAMKMENELRSPRDGKVVEVAVVVGQIVEGGAKLATVE